MSIIAACVASTLLECHVRTWMLSDTEGTYTRAPDTQVRVVVQRERRGSTNI
jgi:hypothetical protein